MRCACPSGGISTTVPLWRSYRYDFQLFLLQERRSQDVRACMCASSGCCDDYCGSELTWIAKLENAGANYYEYELVRIAKPGNIGANYSG